MRARSWPLQEKAQFLWVLEHSLLVTNARETLMFGVFLGWFKVTASIFLLCWLSIWVLLKVEWLLKVGSVQIPYPGLSQFGPSQRRLSSLVWAIQSYRSLFSLFCVTAVLSSLLSEKTKQTKQKKPPWV
jgi:hypothetical protein